MSPRPTGAVSHRTPMPDPLALTHLDALMAETEGSPDVVVGMIDGPVDTTHPDLADARVHAAGSGPGAACRVTGSEACHHGTFVAGILSARRGGEAPGIAPGSPLVVRPIFCEAPTVDACPLVTPDELARAVGEAVRAGVRVLNMSVGLEGAAMRASPALRDAFDLAAHRGVLLVAAAGNEGAVGPVALFQHPAVLPVAASDPRGGPWRGSNLGISVGRQGVLAPGEGIVSTAAGGGYLRSSGTSAAAAFVSGAAALLWSLHPGAAASEVRRALLRPGARRTSIVPPLLHGTESRAALASRHPTRVPS